jgi:hypothetical protein
VKRGVLQVGGEEEGDECGGGQGELEVEGGGGVRREGV